MQHNVYIYIAVMALVTYLIRTLPLTLVRREIKNVYVRSFLYYVPYVTLTVMTFPAILDATRSPWAGLAALGVGMILAWKGASLLKVAVACCAAVYLLDPEAFTAEPFHCEVDLKGRYTFGMCVVDICRRMGREDNILLLRDADHERVISRLYQ